MVDRQWLGRPKISYLSRFNGFSTNIEVGIPKKNITNLESAVLKRVFHTNESGTLPLRPMSVNGCVKRLAGIRSKILSTPYLARVMTDEEFVMSYDGRKRRVYENALERKKARGVSRKHSFVDVFVKSEKTNMTSKPFKDIIPRVISPRSPIYNIAVGVYLKPMEKFIVKSFARIYGGPTIMKGLNANSKAEALRAMWNSFSSPVAVSIDAKRFDQHVSTTMLRWEHGIYKAKYPNDGVLPKYLKWQLKNKCFGRCADGKLKYVSDGGRMSGDMNTGMGNCLIMSSLAYTYATELEIRHRLADDGDDCVVMFEREHLAKFLDGIREFFAYFGFDVKVETPVFVFEQIEFCQCHPIFMDPGWRMVRNVQYSIAKDCSSIHPLRGEKHALGWLGLVGSGGLALCSGVPIMQELYKTFIRESKGYVAKPTGWETNEGRYILATGLQSKETAVSELTRYSFWLAFGITPDLQVSIEEQYRDTNVAYSEQKSDFHYGSCIPFW